MHLQARIFLIRGLKRNILFLQDLTLTQILMQPETQPEMQAEMQTAFDYPGTHNRSRLVHIGL